MADFTLDEVTAAARESIAPLEQKIDGISYRQDEAERQIQELSRPRPGPQPSQLFGGGPPGISTGESVLSSRGYSFVRLMAYLGGALQGEKCKVELNLGDRMRRVMEENGYVVRGGQSSILVPFGAQMFQPLNDLLADEVRQTVQAGVAGADPEEMRSVAQQLPSGSVSQNLSQWDNTGGGALINVQTVELIELVRARLAFANAGAREIAMPPSGRIQLPRHTGATTAHWVGESESISSSEPTTGTLTLIAKKLAVLVKSPNELIRFSSPSIEQLYRQDMADTIREKMDTTMLTQASSSNAPKGLINYDSVNDLTGDANVVTTGADGDTLLPSGPSMMIAEVEDQDHDANGFVFIMRPRMWRSLLNKRADAVTGSDEAGPFLFNVAKDHQRAGQMGLDGARVVTTTQVPKDRDKGSSTNLSMLIGGTFREWIISTMGAIEFALSTQGDTPFENDETWLRGLIHMDAAPRHESAFVFVDDLNETV